MERHDMPQQTAFERASSLAARLVAMLSIVAATSACVSSETGPTASDLASLRGQPLAKATSMFGEPTGEIRIGGRHTVFWQKSYTEQYAAPSVIRTVSGRDSQSATQETESLKLKTRTHTCIVKLSVDDQLVIKDAVFDGDRTRCGEMISPAS